MLKKTTNKPKKKQLKANLRVPSNRVAIVSRNVFCGANNPFITGIFPAWYRSPHQKLPERRRESARCARRSHLKRPNLCGARRHPVNSAQRGSPGGGGAPAMRAPARSGASVACEGGGRGMRSTGAAQVRAGDDRERARLPVSGAIIAPWDSMTVSPQRAMTGGIDHPQLQLGSERKWGSFSV